MLFAPRKTVPFWFLLLSFSGGLFCASVKAQEIPLFDPAKELDADNWSKPPRKFGGFLLFSEAILTERYTDNVYAQETDEKSDFITFLKPRAVLVKSIGRHNFAMDVAAEGKYYKEYGDENQLNYSMAVLGDLEAYHSFHIPIALWHYTEHINRVDSSQLGISTREPVEVSNNKIRSGFVYDPGRFKLEFLGTYWQKRIPDGVSVPAAPGVTTIGKDRDKDQLKFETTVSYDMSTDWRPLLKLEYADDDYLRRTLTASGFDGAIRDSQTYRALAGIGFDYHGLIAGNLLFGQEFREYDDPAADSLTGFSVDSALKFAPTQRLSGSLGYKKISSDDNILLTGVKQDIYSFSLQQEINSLWSGTAGIEYIETDFLDTSRSDEDYAANLSVIYKIKKGLLLEGGYYFKTRESSDPSAAFDQNTISLSINHQF